MVVNYGGIVREFVTTLSPAEKQPASSPGVSKRGELYNRLIEQTRFEPCPREATLRDERERTHEYRGDVSCRLVLFWPVTGGTAPRTVDTGEVATYDPKPTPNRPLVAFLVQ